MYAGIFVGQFFGVHDQWNVPGRDMTFFTREQAEERLRGLEVIGLEEEDVDSFVADGSGFSIAFRVTGIGVDNFGSDLQEHAFTPILNAIPGRFALERFNCGKSWVIWPQGDCFCMHNDGKAISLVTGETDGWLAQDMLRANGRLNGWNIKKPMPEQSANGGYARLPVFCHGGKCDCLYSLPELDQLPGIQGMIGYLKRFA